MVQPTGFYIKKNQKGNALLVEPGYNTKFPSLALLKFSTYLKKRGYKVQYVKGEKLTKGNFDEIIITSFFTFDWKETIETICYYSNTFPKSNIRVGGIYASLLPRHVEQKSGIVPYTGCIKDVDECAPDYSLLPRSCYYETSRLFTSRGCPRNCNFCGTRLFEPEKRVIANWKSHFLPRGKFSLIHDNNILAHGDDHFSNVLGFLKKKKLMFMFDNGFDCRLFEKRHAKILSRSPITEIRFSFDTMAQDGHVQRAIKQCVKSGISPSKIKIFILYNFKDNVDDALYRVNEVHRLGARAWAMRYRPLDWLYPNLTYISETWDVEDLFYFNSYVNRYSIMNKYSYKEWKARKQLNREITLKNSPWTIENVIDKGKGKAIENNDKESIFDDPKFIISIIKGEEFT